MDIENNLLERIAQRDESAFRVIYEKYYPRVYTYALRYLKSETDAEEVVHEVFLKLWLRDSSALPIKSLNPYLQTLTRNRSFDMLRRKVLENRRDLSSAVTWHEDHNETEELIILNDTKKVLEKGIELLPAQQKQVYLLCREEGLKYEQVAEKLHLSPATVHTHMKLALKFLRVYVQQHTDIAALLIIYKLFQ
ncbi:RNA polymerase sigma-70 factor [Pedobacter frigoris]|uniref:RNA polymerase sigma-70 factor n=1 Tax=Pedobacter frigoris TaxID=2571272 RepID=A0A4U1CCC8_9SPHI|nr:RNA polymerase sigma-70 factor [Pedobacter frigoris]TKC04389.1 RNA polymerase sigma-70 factor [Pedobacter frigoris]